MRVSLVTLGPVRALLRRNSSWCVERGIVGAGLGGVPFVRLFSVVLPLPEILW